MKEFFNQYESFDNDLKKVIEYVIKENGNLNIDLSNQSINAKFILMNTGYLNQSFFITIKLLKLILESDLTKEVRALQVAANNTDLYLPPPKRNNVINNIVDKIKNEFIQL